MYFSLYYSLAALPPIPHRVLPVCLQMKILLIYLENKNTSYKIIWQTLRAPGQQLIVLPLLSKSIYLVHRYQSLEFFNTSGLFDFSQKTSIFSPSLFFWSYNYTFHL